MMGACRASDCFDYARDGTLGQATRCQGMAPSAGSLFHLVTVRLGGGQGIQLQASVDRSAPPRWPDHA